MNKSVMKCCICNNENIGEFITINNEKYHLCCIKQLQQENQKLKKQLEYLRSGEYYNQLRFENEMLQQVVDTNGVPSEVYDYIDCTHRNTELLEENQKYKEVIDKAIEYIEKLNEIIPRLWFTKLLDILKEVE